MKESPENEAIAMLRVLSARRPADPSEEGELAMLLAERVAEARTAWPAVVTTDADLAEHLGRHLPDEVPLAEALVRWRAADLYLAFACGRGDAAALAAFEDVFGNELRIVRARLGSGAGADADDFVQHCREKLFAPPRPKIADYSGQGDLRHWLRVTLVRVLIDWRRSRRQRDAREELDGDRGLEAAAQGDDPELDLLKTRYREEFRQAFEQAARALEAQDRNLLRRHFSDGLSIDELGALYGVHRATAARRLARARAELLAGTRRLLADKLALRPAELDSVLRMIESNVHVTLSRVLSSEPREA
jgi:RNA polymerase sigma-70 factor, ECF subfamily